MTSAYTVSLIAECSANVPLAFGTCGKSLAELRNPTGMFGHTFRNWDTCIVWNRCGTCKTGE